MAATASTTGAATATSGSDCTRSRIVFVETGGAGRDLQLGRAGDALAAVC